MNTYKKVDISMATGGLLLFFLMMGSNVPATLYEIYAVKFRFNTLILTGIFATYVIFLVPTLLISGKYADKHGRKSIVYAGIVLAIAGLLSFIFAANYYELFMARAFQGAATGLISGPLTALLVDLDRDKTKASFITTISTSTGTATGPFLGGAMAEYFIFPLESVYFISLVLLVIISIFVVKMPETVHRKELKINIKKPVMPENVKRILLFSSFSSFVAWSVTAFFMSLAPSYITTVFGLNNYAIAGGIVFLMLISSAFIQILFRKSLSEESIVYGFMLLLASILGIILSVPYHSLIILVFSTVLAGTGMGIAFLGAMKMIVKDIPADYKASVLSKFYIITYAGVGVPVVAIGGIALLTGLFISVIYYYVFIIIMVSILIIMRQKYKIKNV
ncbi:MFS transporter [Ferroplasma sp.]|uniref:MFS transporter n=1 Tax=Ferroplasma sp. TaxID=2591003 RepID=UPI00307DFDE6